MTLANIFLLNLTFNFWSPDKKGRIYRLHSILILKKREKACYKGNKRPPVTKL